jgi:hypothetical protein
MRKEKRKKEIKRRKNFFPTLIVLILSWGSIFAVVYLIDPTSLGAVPAFFILVFIASIFTFSTLFANTRRGVISALALTLFLVLRYLGIGHILNFLLIFGLAITIEVYFSRNSP